MAVSTLYEGATGIEVGKVDEGEGLRQKTWLDELSRWAMEMATERGLGSAGTGILANFPSIVEGAVPYMGAKPIGEAYSAPAFNGWELYEAVQQSGSLGTGDAAILEWGDVVLAEPDPLHADFYNATTDPDDPVNPLGASAPAFLQTVVETWNLTGLLTLTLVVNGTTHAIPITTANAAAVTDLELQESILASGAPVNCFIDAASTKVRIMAIGNGITSNIMAVNAGAATVLFTGAGLSSQPGVMYYGTGGPLGQMDNTDAVGGVKPQRRILPGSININITMGGEVVAVTDSTITTGNTGTLSGQNAAGTATVTGTINYVTGVISVTTAGDAADNATTLDASWRALIPINLHEPVRRSPAGRHYAMLLAS